MNTEPKSDPTGGALWSLPKWLTRVDGGLQRIQEWAIFLLMGVLILMTLLQVVFRLIPGVPSYPWLDTLSRWTVLWVGLLGASLAAATGKHISIDVLSRLLPVGIRGGVQGIAGFFTLIVLGIVVYSSVGFALLQHQGVSSPLLVLEFLGTGEGGAPRGIYDSFFTNPMPLILMLILWHSFVRWKATLSSSRAGSIVSWVMGGFVMLVTVESSVELVLGGSFAPVTSLVESVVGGAVSSAPMTIVAMSLFMAMLGAPLYVVLAAMALVGMYAQQSIPIQNFFPDPVGNIRKSTIFLAIPLFTMAGYLMAEGKSPARLVGLFRGFLGWLPGGVAIVALVACSFFTAFTGASGVTIIALGGLLLPILLADRYPEKFALGLLTTGGSRGLIFPPSIPIFLLAMILGLNWDGATMGVDFGQAVSSPEQRQQVCEEKVRIAKQQVAFDSRHRSAGQEVSSAADEAVRRELDRLKLAPTSHKPAVGDDEFDLGDDESFGEDEGGEGPADDAGDGDDGDGRGDPLGGPDEFDLGSDDTFAEEPEADDAASLEGLASMNPMDLPAERKGAKLEAPTPQDIFKAGLVPGLLMVLAVSVFCVIVGSGKDIVRTRFQWRDALASVWQARFEVPIPVLIGVGIFGGFFTPAEAATVTVSYTLLMELLLYRDFGFRSLKKATVESVVLVGGIIVILMTASGLLNYLVHANVPTAVLTFIEQTVPEEISVLGMFTITRQIAFLMLLNVFLLVVGCLMDIFSAILVVLPLLLPIAYRFGVHPLHLAVIFVVNLEIGYSTPPVGINLFVASLRFGRPITKLYAASVAFLVIMLVGLLLVTYVPSLSLWMLPEVSP
jgi:TRAP-type C4-dicarboxylate transport system permease large subunit/TRAP-type C4-dicarboxylate transport system permease small subunit